MVEIGSRINVSDYNFIYCVSYQEIITNNFREIIT
jgi:hypothetical protein